MKTYLLIAICLMACEQSQLDNEKSESNQSNNRVLSSENLLWNDEGVKLRSYIHLNLHNVNGSLQTQTRIRNMCDLSQVDEVGNPAPSNPDNYFSYETDQGTIAAINGAAPSFNIVTNGYSNEYHASYPGFAAWVQNGWMGIPLEFKFFNSAKQLTNENSAENLHEVGLVFQHFIKPWPWSNKGKHAFKDQYRVSDFEEIRPKFDIRLDGFNNYNSPNQNGLRITTINLDFRIEYRNPNDFDDTIRRDQIGIIFYNANNYDFDGNNDAIFWEDDTPNTSNPNDPFDRNRITFHGHRLGLGIPQLNQSNAFTNIEFDLMPIIQQYYQPPADLTYEDAIIVGMDIYSSTRYADISFSLKDIYLMGHY